MPYWFHNGGLVSTAKFFLTFSITSSELFSFGKKMRTKSSSVVFKKHVQFFTYFLDIDRTLTLI